MESVRKCVLSVLLLSAVDISSAAAQSVVGAQDGTGTQITSSSSNPNQFDIGGGTQAGANLFHSLEKFGLSQGQIANFLSNPNIQNILGRVVGGDASVIDGLIQVTGGDSNLFLMNPAGMLFGPNASLNVPGSFIATTADGIQIDEQWFKAIGSNDYEKLVGEPNGYGFVADEPGAIVNAGDLEVPQGERIALVGGTVVNTGKLTAPGGDVTIAAVEGEQLVRVSQEGSVLSLDLPVDAKAALTEQTQPLKPASLPQLLTGGEFEHAAGVAVEDGVVKLTASRTVIPDEPGVAIASGTLDASNTEPPVSDTQAEGGDITVLGDKVGVIAADIDASGTNGGGQILMGGNYKGQGPEPNAQRTFVSNDSDIRADAIQAGDGGRVIVWADEAMDYRGDISARGGSGAGDGGFVEVSGKEHLVFRGDVDLTAENGTSGTLLLDPGTITITDKVDGPGSLDGEMTDVFTSVLNNAKTISEGKLESFGQDANIVLEANDGITVNDLEDNLLDLELGTGGSITFRADANDDLTGDFIMNSGDTIRTQGGAVEISGAGLTVGEIDTSAQPGGGEITLESVEADINTGNLNSSSFSDNNMNGDAGAIRLDAQGGISTGDILASANVTGDEGSVTLIAKTGPITVRDIIDRSGEFPQAGAGAVTLSSSTGQIRTEDIRSGGNDVKISGADITAGSIRAGDPVGGDNSSVTLTAAKEDVIVDTISAGFGGIDVTAARLFRAEEFLLVSDVDARSVKLGVDPELDAFVENLDNQTRQQVIQIDNDNVRFVSVRVSNLPVSLVAGANEGRITIRHGGQSLNSGISSITIQGHGNLPEAQFVVGPQTSGTFKLNTDEDAVVRTGFSPLSFPSDQFPADMSGTVGAIVRQGANEVLVSSFQNRPFKPPLADDPGGAITPADDPGGVSAITLAAQTLELEENTSSEEDCDPSDPECGPVEEKLLDVSGVQQSPEPK